ncbi:MAG: penicillin-binding protein 1C, partial [Planctomycetes bacterium]|nr:penicillin-binding protein 1C [Planctomycetota bacterium]
MKLPQRALHGLPAGIVFLALGYSILCVVFPYPHARLESAVHARPATLVLDREGNVLRAFTGDNDSWMFRIDYDAMSPRLIQATIAVEDERFRLHPGVDPISIVRAALSNVRRGRTVSGASTITMQAVRLVHPRPRTLCSKIIEAFRASQMERLLTKEELLELYLNLAPYGGNLTGAEAASLSYFRKHARDLTLAEAALLAGLPQSPSRLRPDRHPARARTRRDHVLRRMHTCGYVTPDELRRALAENVCVRRAPLPFQAPHFCRLVKNRFPQEHTLRTTIDSRIQADCEISLRSALAGLRNAGVSNGAAVVIENKTAAVRAMVGSCDFFSEEDHGQVNGATAARSPGSTIKPFTYGLAFEQGLCTPRSVLADVPANYSGYAPKNYDHLYRGPVTARDALSLSLNVPAVRLARDVGLDRLCNFLRQVGLTTLRRNASHYGLGLTLGSAEVTLLDLTNAYATLARLGVYRPYRLLETEPIRSGKRVLSEEAAYLVADVLSDTARLEGRCLWKSDKTRVRMAWKTGTSWGHRDAWAVAYTQKYTVGIWVGNFSGRPAKALVGIQAAAPIAARIMDQLHTGRPPGWFSRPEGIGRREVCSVSGMPAGEHCGARSAALYISGRSATRRCTIHEQVKIDRETGALLCRNCAKGRDYASKVVEAWPVQLASWLRVHQPDRSLAPVHLAGCRRTPDMKKRPRILSPAPGQTYLLTGSASQSNQK